MSRFLLINGCPQLKRLPTISAVTPDQVFHFIHRLYHWFRCICQGNNRNGKLQYNSWAARRYRESSNNIQNHSCRHCSDNKNIHCCTMDFVAIKIIPGDSTSTLCRIDNQHIRLVHQIAKFVKPINNIGKMLRRNNTQQKKEMTSAKMWYGVVCTLLNAPGKLLKNFPPRLP